ncbi:hypothetical protein [Tunicatimonas pelagia]|uniref:hypothetical protein n=1 Tax=Tunicatimonas pelagia TaxID=931531 RepID=UPI002666A89D|nr:hypothetical protein [Tunicatimonas pelagia]WKN42208.1 hypothetical protein P0M28_24530 [Tunicatimonas pelagia]WKN45326.1 hypothetical protein P0M28_10180 [Tunicatimonas pelagia]
MARNSKKISTVVTLTGDADSIIAAFDTWKQDGVTVKKLSVPADLLANALTEENVEVKVSLHGDMEAVYGRAYDVLEKASVRRYTSEYDGVAVDHTSY